LGIGDRVRLLGAIAAPSAAVARYSSSYSPDGITMV
jgi:hypothetical protein